MGVAFIYFFSQCVGNADAGKAELREGAGGWLTRIPPRAGAQRGHGGSPAAAPRPPLLLWACHLPPCLRTRCGGENKHHHRPRNNMKIKINPKQLHISSGQSLPGRKGSPQGEGGARRGSPWGSGGGFGAGQHGGQPSRAGTVQGKGRHPSPPAGIASPLRGGRGLRGGIRKKPQAPGSLSLRKPLRSGCGELWQRHLLSPAGAF